jgi:hypothetical protein
VVTFRATVEQRGKTACGITVPPAVVEALGRGKRPPVRVTIKGYTYRSTVAAYTDEYLVGVSAEHRAAGDIAPWEVVDVTLELDTEPRVIQVPDDFAAALAGDPAALAFFEGLSYSNKSRFVLSVEGAKTPETRQRRIDKAIASLGEGRL